MADGGQDTMQAERTRLTLVLTQPYLQVSRLLLLRRDPATGNGLKAGAASGADSAWGLMGFEAEAPESLGTRTSNRRLASLPAPPRSYLHWTCLC